MEYLKSDETKKKWKKMGFGKEYEKAEEVEEGGSVMDLMPKLGKFFEKKSIAGEVDRLHKRIKKK